MNGMVGAPYAQDRHRFYIQSNNPTEQALKIYGKKTWLVSCGPTAMINCLAAIGVDVEVCRVGAYTPQPEEIVFDFLNDPRNLPALMSIRSLDLGALGIGANEVPQYYPYVAAQMYRATGRYSDRLTVEEIRKALVEGSAIQLSISAGHYIAVVGFIGDTYYFHDSWPNRVGGDGFLVPISEGNLEAISKRYGIIYQQRMEGLF